MSFQPSPNLKIPTINLFSPLPHSPRTPSKPPATSPKTFRQFLSETPTHRKLSYDPQQIPTFSERKNTLPALPELSLNHLRSPSQVIESPFSAYFMAGNLTTSRELVKSDSGSFQHPTVIEERWQITKMKPVTPGKHLHRKINQEKESFKKLMNLKEELKEAAIAKSLGPTKMKKMLLNSTIQRLDDENNSKQICLDNSMRKKKLKFKMDLTTPRERHIKEILVKVNKRMNPPPNIIEPTPEEIAAAEAQKKQIIDLDDKRLYFGGHALPNALAVGCMGLSEMTSKMKEYRVIMTEKLKQISLRDGTQTGLQRFYDPNQNKLEIHRKFLKHILNIVKKLQLLGLSSDEVYNKKAFPRTAYERSGSRRFMLAVKMNYYFEVEAILRKCKYHVYDIDELKMTPLHWTMKKGLTRMAKLLLDYGADPNAQDISGRTPLILAAHASHIVSVKLLISFGADPMIRSEGHKIAFDYAKDPQIKTHIQRCYKINIILSACSLKKRREVWNNLKSEFAVDEDELE